MAKVFARIAIMVVAVRVWQPLITGITALEMMRLMKALVVNSLSRALQAHREHGNYQQTEDPDTHSGGSYTNSTLLTDTVHIIAAGPVAIRVDRKKADAMLTKGRSDLVPGTGHDAAKSFMDQILAGDAKVEGNAGVLMQLKSTLVSFDPMFEIMPGTARIPRESPPPVSMAPNSRH